eukprot:5060028-Alexandrium_andersonii.AAC.1
MYASRRAPAQPLRSRTIINAWEGTDSVESTKNPCNGRPVPPPGAPPAAALSLQGGGGPLRGAQHRAAPSR